MTTKKGKSMKITKAWLLKHEACLEGREWWKKSGLTDHRKIALQLLKEKQYLWANWMLVRLMNHKDQVRYALHAAESALPIFEKKHPKDDRPRRAIETTKKWLDGRATIEEVRAAASDASAAAFAAYAAAFAADAASDASAAAFAAYAASDAADAADDAKRHEVWTAQINYGLKLIEGEK